MSDEFTPTLEEFIHSFVPSRWPIRTPEDLFYWNIKGSILLSSVLVRTAMLMRTGMTFAHAGYVATDTFGMYRVMSKARTIGHIVRASPAILAGVAFHEVGTAVEDALGLPRNIEGTAFDPHYSESAQRARLIEAGVIPSRLQ